jgi:hypothetical protein
MVWFPERARDFSLLFSVEIGCRAHPASYPVCTVGYFPGSTAAWPWSWPLTSIYCRGKELWCCYLHSLVRLYGVALKYAEGLRLCILRNILQHSTTGHMGLMHLSTTSLSATQEIPSFHRTQRFIMMLTLYNLCNWNSVVKTPKNPPVYLKL